MKGLGDIDYAQCISWRCIECQTVYSGTWDDETDTVTNSDKGTMGCPWCGGVCAEPDYEMYAELLDEALERTTPE